MSARDGDSLGGTRHAPGLDAALVAVLAGLLASRTLVAWTPLVHFDIDPSSVSREAVIPFAGLGPAGSLAIDALTSGVAGVLLWRLARARIGWPAWMALLAALLASLDVALVLRGDFENLWRGSAWCSAILGAGALAACGGHPSAASLRRIALAVLVGASAAWIVRGGVQLVSEHPETVAQFRATKDAFFAAQGWDPASAQALTYERRMMQREATGWFGLANIMAGLCAAVAVGAAGTALAARRGARATGVIVLLALAVGAAAIVLINGSKGAIAAMAIGGAAALLARRSTWHARAALCAAMAIPVLAVLARGALGESLGERSLLFRSQYWDGAWRVAVEAWPWGTGPDAFQAAYTRLRPWTAVEEVTSAHAAPVDWFATLGLAGLLVTAAWVALVVRAGEAGRDGAESASGAGAGDALVHDEPSHAGGRDEWMVALVGLVLATVVSVIADPAGRFIPLLALPAAAWVARVVIDALRAASGAALRAVVVGVTAVLACHAMIEMTAWQPGSASWVLGVVGACAMVGGASLSVPAVRAPAHGIRAAVAVVASLALLASIGQAALARTVQLQERTIDAAAEALVENLFTPPSRAKAGELLATAFDEHASLRRHLLLAKSADQWLQAGLAETDPARARVWFDEALAHAARCRAAMPLRAALEASAITQAMAERGLVPFGAVVDAGEAVLVHDPRHTMTMVRIAEALARTGEAERAAEWARRALEADASFALDPLRHMPAAARSRCEALVGVSPG
ncbi:MAG: hypothetical protein ACO3DS_00645 [Phycisphaerales bacterium]